MKKLEVWIWKDTETDHGEQKDTTYCIEVQYLWYF